MIQFTKKSLPKKILDNLPLILLFVSVLNEFDLNYLRIEYFSFNFVFTLIFYWTLKSPRYLSYGAIFVAGLINDVVMSFPLGISSLSYLIVCFFANYVRNKSVNTTIASDWFTFFLALIFANLLFFLMLNKFSDLAISYSKISYNTFFTLFLFPVFWLIFNIYQMNFIGGKDA